MVQEPIYRVAGLAALGLLGVALYWTVRLEQADWLFIKGDAASLRQAIRMAPGNAEYYRSLAEADPKHAASILRQAIARNPLNSSLRLELGLAAERQGDFREAEADMLEAVRLDTGFAPRWALSDFYFHRRDAEKFWPVVKGALAMSHDDVSAQFHNCWSFTADPQTILDRAIPDRPDVWRKYLDFLLSEGRLQAAEAVAGKVLAGADREAVPSLLNYCDRTLAKGRVDQAVLIWNGLTEGKWIAAPDLRRPGSGHGFDWQISAANGIYTEGTSAGLRVSFSGKQPENVEILSQYVPLRPRQHYTLTVRYRASGIGAESGLTYSLPVANGRDLLQGRGLLQGGDGSIQQSMAFETPDDANLGRLVFGYHRVLGTVRIEGSVTLQEFAITLAGDGR